MGPGSDTAEPQGQIAGRLAHPGGGLVGPDELSDRRITYSYSKPSGAERAFCSSLWLQVTIARCRPCQSGATPSRMTHADNSMLTIFAKLLSPRYLISCSRVSTAQVDTGFRSTSH